MSKPAIAVSQQLQALARKLDEDIEKIAGQRVGFSLFVYTPERMNYISSIDRAEAIAVLENVLEGWKQGMPDVPAHKVS